MPFFMLRKQIIEGKGYFVFEGELRRECLRTNVKKMIHGGKGDGGHRLK